jgi:hypothetical protein
MLASIEQLIVHEEGGGGFRFDSLEFIPTHNHGTIIAGAIGTMVNDASVELVVWALGDVITRLELEPFGEMSRSSLSDGGLSTLFDGVPCSRSRAL